MKKEPVSALSTESSLQKIQRAPLPPGSTAGGGSKTIKTPRLKGPASAVTPNGGSSNGRKVSAEEGHGLDANRVLSALIALKKGDFGARLPVNWTGIAGKLADTFNDLAEMMSLSTA